MSPPHPPKPLDGPLATYWNREVRELVEVTTPALGPQACERHAMYCYLVMALVAHYWNGNIHGRRGTYRWRNEQMRQDEYETYLGHNIACLAVNGRGHVLDF